VKAQTNRDFKKARDLIPRAGKFARFKRGGGGGGGGTRPKIGSFGPFFFRGGAGPRRRGRAWGPFCVPGQAFRGVGGGGFGPGWGGPRRLSPPARGRGGPRKGPGDPLGALARKKGGGAPNVVLATGPAGLFWGHPRPGAGFSGQRPGRGTPGGPVGGKTPLPGGEPGRWGERGAPPQPAGARLRGSAGRGGGGTKGPKKPSWAGGGQARAPAPGGTPGGNFFRGPGFRNKKKRAEPKGPMAWGGFRPGRPWGGIGWCSGVFRGGKQGVPEKRVGKVSDRAPAKRHKSKSAGGGEKARKGARARFVRGGEPRPVGATKKPATAWPRNAGSHPRAGAGLLCRSVCPGPVCGASRRPSWPPSFVGQGIQPVGRALGGMGRGGWTGGRGNRLWDQRGAGGKSKDFAGRRAGERWEQG